MIIAQYLELKIAASVSRKCLAHDTLLSLEHIDVAVATGLRTCRSKNGTTGNQVRAIRSCEYLLNHMRRSFPLVKQTHLIVWSYPAAKKSAEVASGSRSGNHTSTQDDAHLDVSVLIARRSAPADETDGR